MAQIIKSANAPVTLDELKNHLHMFTSDFDSSLELNLRAAVAKAESYTNTCIWQVEQQVSVPFAKKVEVPGYNVVLSDVKVDGENVNFTFDSGVLAIDSPEGATLTYTVTQGYSSENCPVDIKMAILLIAAKFFNNPVDSVEQLPTASQALLHPYKVYCI